METTTVEKKYRSRRTVFKLYPLGDIHAGTLNCSESIIKAKVNEIKADPFALWIGMGDYGEFITPHDPRWDIASIAPWVERTNVAESQRKWIVNLLKPIANKCIGLLEGNHEDAVRVHNCQDVYLDLCRDLGVTPLGYSCFVKFRFVRQTQGHRDSYTYIGHFEHGSGGAQSEGGKMNRLKKGLMGFDADIYGCGHLHDIKIDSTSVLYVDDGNNVRSKERVAALTGSWFASYEQGVRASYAEKRGYSPTPIGCPVFIIVPDKRIVRVSLGNE